MRVCEDRFVRFLTLADVAETLNISSAQAYALVRSGELRAIKVGGRGQWRVETTELEAYIERAYAQTAALLADLDPAEDRSELS
jgi:excisionase family DNA binding protein